VRGGVDQGRCAGQQGLVVWVRGRGGAFRRHSPPPVRRTVGGVRRTPPGNSLGNATPAACRRSKVRTAGARAGQGIVTPRPEVANPPRRSGKIFHGAATTEAPLRPREAERAGRGKTTLRMGSVRRAVRDRNGRRGSRRARTRATPRARSWKENRSSRRTRAGKRAGRGSTHGDRGRRGVSAEAYGNPRSGARMGWTAAAKVGAGRSRTAKRGVSRIPKSEAGTYSPRGADRQAKKVKGLPPFGAAARATGRAPRPRAAATGRARAGRRPPRRRHRRRKTR